MESFIEKDMFNLTVKPELDGWRKGGEKLRSNFLGAGVGEGSICFTPYSLEPYISALGGSKRNLPVVQISRGSLPTALNGNFWQTLQSLVLMLLCLELSPYHRCLVTCSLSLR